MMWEDLRSKIASPHDEYASMLEKAQRQSAAGKAWAVYQHGDMYRSRMECLIMNWGK